MPAEALRPLLDRMKEFDTRREADRRARYGKLVLRVARGEDLGGPEQVTTAVEALGRDVDEFQADIEYAAERLELRAVADQLAPRTDAKHAAAEAAQAAEAVYSAELRRLEEAHSARIAAARAAYEAAARRVEEASRAALKLVETCRDTEALDQLERNGKEQSALRQKIAQARADAHKWADEADTAAHIERQERATARIIAPAPFGSINEAGLPDTPGRKHRQELIRIAPAAIAEAEGKAAALEARLAELVAEAAALEARLSEPWPLTAAPRG